MMVKICGITNLSDALAAAGGGAAALGFNFWPGSPRYISPGIAASITARIPENILKVGVFVNQPEESLRQIMEEAGLDIAQLHGSESPCTRLTLRIWKAFRITEDWSESKLDDWNAEAFLLDSVNPGSGQTFDWSRVRGLRQRIILAGGLDASNVAGAIRAVRPWGVDACSRLEAAPGRKDHEKMTRFLKAALSETA